MSAEQLRRLNLYMLAIAIGAIVAGGGVLQNQLATTGEFNPTPVLAAMLGALITGLTTSVLPALKQSVEQPAGTEVDQLIDRLEALPKEDRDELTTRMEWRARLRGELN